MRVRTVLRSSCWRGPALMACLFGVSAVDAHSGVDGRTVADYSNPEMRQAVTSYRAGKLAAAWKSLVESLETAPAESAFEDFVRCGDDSGCPHMSWLGTVLGETFPGAALSLCDRLRKSSRRDCRNLMREYRRFHDEGPHLVEAQRVAMNRQLKEGHSGRPIAIVGLDGTFQSALVDTGTTKTAFKPGIENKSRFVAAGTIIDADGMRHRSPLVRVDNLTLGAVRFSRPKLFVYEGLGPETPVVVGMDVLLRHAAVCFDWRRQTLHLGELGPCAGGGQGFGATLNRMLKIELSLLTHTGERISGVLDTGATSTYCPERIATPETSG